MAVYIEVRPGAGSFVKGDRVQWCRGLNGVVLGVCGSLVMVETDDGVTRTAGEAYLSFADEALAR